MKYRYYYLIDTGNIIRYDLAKLFNGGVIFNGNFHQIIYEGCMAEAVRQRKLLEDRQMEERIRKWKINTYKS